MPTVLISSEDFARTAARITHDLLGQYAFSHRDVVYWWANRALMQYMKHIKAETLDLKRGQWFCADYMREWEQVSGMPFAEPEYGWMREVKQL